MNLNIRHGAEGLILLIAEAGDGKVITCVKIDNLQCIGKEAALNFIHIDFDCQLDLLALDGLQWDDMEYPTGIASEGCVFGDVTEVETIFRGLKTEPTAFGNIDVMEYPKT